MQYYNIENGSLHAGGGGGDDAAGADFGARRATPQDDATRAGRDAPPLNYIFLSSATRKFKFRLSTFSHFTHI